LKEGRKKESKKTEKEKGKEKEKQKELTHNHLFFPPKIDHSVQQA